MSINSFFFVRDDKLPTIAEWQAALDQASTGIVLGDDRDLRTRSGYLPAAHRGERSGFEWYYSTLAGRESYFSPLLKHFEDISRQAHVGRDHVINCVTFSDMRELVCGLVACSILSQLADGVFLDQNTKQFIDAIAVLEFARRLELSL